MECPNCGERTGVYGGGKSINGQYMRRRKCGMCGFKMVTLERIINVHVQGDGKWGGARKPLNLEERARYASENYDKQRNSHA